MTYQHILAEQEGPILTLTLNRPDKLNAYTARMGVEIEEAFRGADADDSVRAIVVTGAGKGFCAGADISAGAGAFDSSGGRNAEMFGSGRQRGGEGFIGAIYRCRKPSIAAVNGAAVGVGVTLTLPMDIRIASVGARFGFVFARRGLVPEAGSAWFLPRLVGLPQAMRWCLDGGVFDAAEALRGGLVGEVTEGDVLARAKEIARGIAENTAPVSAALTRRMLWEFSGAPDPFALLKMDAALSVELGAGPDVREGVAAFLEKRRPNFPGKVSSDMPKTWVPE